FHHASRASQGARPYQEDSAAVWPGEGSLVPKTTASPPDGTALVAVLADGMGGHAGGALASATICQAFLEHYASRDLDGHQRLTPALEAANRAVSQKVRANPNLAGMGATLVGASIGPAGLSWVSVGDSPMYLFRNDELVQVNEDHSLAPVIDRMVAQGKMSAEEAKADPRRHYLRSAVTGEDLELIDAPGRPLKLVAGDVVIISSDGIHTLEPDEIRSIVSANLADGPAVIANALVRAVDDAGVPHQDNTTVVVVSISEEV
ncbi:MAG: serine/threonine-protein phosphatase, partial [Proteobacteria bacterium]|nr:serine/threonine-protein phosphatase [Pseudomonadota bacterium]